MATLGFAVNVNDLPAPSNNFEPLPAGWYTVTVTGAEMKTTKAGTGQYISVAYSVVGPTHQGRMVFGNLNIQNPNPKAEEIGRQQLGELMRAIGLTQVTDTDQLIGGTLTIKLAVTKSEQYGDGNDVKGYKAVAGGAPPMPAASTTAPASAPAAGSAPPWAKK